MFIPEKKLKSLRVEDQEAYSLDGLDGESEAIEATTKPSLAR